MDRPVDFLAFDRAVVYEFAAAAFTQLRFRC